MTEDFSRTPLKELKELRSHVQELFSKVDYLSRWNTEQARQLASLENRSESTKDLQPTPEPGSVWELDQTKDKYIVISNKYSLSTDKDPSGHYVHCVSSWNCFHQIRVRLQVFIREFTFFSQPAIRKKFHE